MKPIRAEKKSSCWLRKKKRQEKCCQQHHAKIGRVNPSNSFIYIGTGGGRSVKTSENQKSTEHKKTVNGYARVEKTCQRNKGGNATRFSKVGKADTECKIKPKEIKVVFVRNIRHSVFRVTFTGQNVIICILNLQ